MTPARAARFQPTGAGHRVTDLELFFDIVFVLAITRIEAVIEEDLTFAGLGKGLLLLGLMWWAWSSYAWLGNQVRADRGVPRVAIMFSTLMMVAVGLAIPSVWAAEGGPSRGPLLFAVCLGLVRAAHLASYFVAAAGDRDLRDQVLRAAIPVGAGGALLVGGALLGPPWHAVLWILALVVDYGGVYASGSGWRLNSTAHFSERYALIVIIALGEAIVATGSAPADSALTGALVMTAILVAATGIGLFRMYFGVLAPMAERALASAEGAERVAIARDAFSYLHLPFVGGIILAAVGSSQVIHRVAAWEPERALPLVARLALFGGVAVALVADAAFRLRVRARLGRARAVGLLVLLAAIPVSASLPAPVCQSMLAAVLVVVAICEIDRPPHPAPPTGGPHELPALRDDPRGHAERRRMRGLPTRRRNLGASTHVSRMRTRGLLRLLAASSRDEAPPRHLAPRRPVRGAG